MEIEVECTCPHCGKGFNTTVNIEPSDWYNDRD